jgi:hypothetical protein
VGIPTVPGGTMSSAAGSGISAPRESSGSLTPPGTSSKSVERFEVGSEGEVGAGLDMTSTGGDNGGSPLLALGCLISESGGVEAPMGTSAEDAITLDVSIMKYVMIITHPTTSCPARA